MQYQKLIMLKELILIFEAATPQTPKCHHDRGAAEVVVTFGSLWGHMHDPKRGISFFSIMVPKNQFQINSRCQAKLPLSRYV